MVSKKSSNAWLESLSPENRAIYINSRNQLNRERYASDPAKRAAVRECSLRQYHEKRNDVLIYLGGRCAGLDCLWVNSDGSLGCTDERCLQIDHVNGDGAKKRCDGEDRGTVFYRKVLKTAPGVEYQLLCANCNWIKRSVNKELPQARLSGTDYVHVDKRKLRAKDEKGRFVAAVAGGS